MNSKVKVTADAVGNVVIPSKNNAEWGHIRVEQERIVIDERGFARKKRVSALIPGLIADLKSFGWKAGQELKGTIIFKEQLTPFNPVIRSVIIRLLAVQELYVVSMVNQFTVKHFTIPILKPKMCRSWMKTTIQFLIQMVKRFVLLINSLQNKMSRLKTRHWVQCS